MTIMRLSKGSSHTVGNLVIPYFFLTFEELDFVRELDLEEDFVLPDFCEEDDFDRELELVRLELFSLDDLSDERLFTELLFLSATEL